MDNLIQRRNEWVRFVKAHETEFLNAPFTEDSPYNFSVLSQQLLGLTALLEAVEEVKFETP
jgi:hypothetical protein